MKKLLHALFVLLILTPVTGELWRLPLAGFEFLPSDLLIPVIFVLWVADKIHNDRRLRLGKIGKAMLVFMGVMVISYLINFYRFPWKQMVIAFSYMGRFGMYLVLAPILFDLLKRDKKGELRTLLVYSMIVSMVLVVILGFLQLKFFPSFLELGLYLSGWDPHIGRLLSTWFDPNFVAGFLAFMLPVVMALGLHYRHEKDWKGFYWMAGVSAVGLIALYLTFSRSGYLAFMAALALLAFFRSRKLLVAGVLIMVLAFGFSPRVRERTLSASDSAKALIGLDSQKPLDPTAELRVWSWTFAREIITEHPWLGVGYGRYAYEINRRGHGLLSDHASGGSDSSILTIWASTGLLGVLSYLAIGTIAAVSAIRRFWKKRTFRTDLDAGLVAGFGGMMVHSVFVNSLLFPLIMVYLMVGLALLDES